MNGCQAEGLYLEAGQDCGCEEPAIAAASVEAGSCWPGLQLPLGIMPKEDMLGALPQAGPGHLLHRPHLCLPSILTAPCAFPCSSDKVSAMGCRRLLWLLQ